MTVERSFEETVPDDPALVRARALLLAASLLNGLVGGLWMLLTALWWWKVWGSREERFWGGWRWDYDWREIGELFGGPVDPTAPVLGGLGGTALVVAVLVAVRGLRAGEVTGRAAFVLGALGGAGVAASLLWPHVSPMLSKGPSTPRPAEVLYLAVLALPSLCCLLLNTFAFLTQRRLHGVAGVERGLLAEADLFDSERAAATAASWIGLVATGLGAVTCVLMALSLLPGVTREPVFWVAIRVLVAVSGAGVAAGGLAIRRGLFGHPALLRRGGRFIACFGGVAAVGMALELFGWVLPFTPEQTVPRTIAALLFGAVPALGGMWLVAGHSHGLAKLAHRGAGPAVAEAPAGDPAPD